MLCNQKCKPFEERLSFNHHCKLYARHLPLPFPHSSLPNIITDAWRQATKAWRDAATTNTGSSGG